MKEKILDILENVCGTDEVKQNRDINLFEEGILDSLGFIELLVELEEKLKIKIDPTEADRSEIDTPNKLIDYINNKK